MLQGSSVTPGRSILVQKYGGTSMGSPERIKAVAKRVLQAQAEGFDVVVVVSAMSGETNRLVALAQNIATSHAEFSSPAYDMLLSSGEQVAVALLALAIGFQKARPYLGHQIGIRTDSVYSKARIREIDTTILYRDLSQGLIPIVAGFQGVDDQNNITTLGRGGSDTSAVAIAAALRAADCEIFTDVDGVYSADPRIVPKATKVKKLSYDEMMELANLGAKVLQVRSVELAAKHNVPVHVRSSFNESEGSRIMSLQKLRENKTESLEQLVVIGIAHDSNQTKVNLSNFPTNPGAMADLFRRLSARAVVVDVIVQSMNAQGQDLCFTVAEADAPLVEEVLRELDAARGRAFIQKNLAKVSIVGVGMQHYHGVAAKMFETLAELGIKIELISTSEIKISALIDRNQMERAVQGLHRAFELE